MARAQDSASSSAGRRRLIRRPVTLCVALAASSVAALFLHDVLGRAHLEAPRPTPILYDRNGAFLTQIGHELPSRRDDPRHLDYGYWPLERLPDRVVRATLAIEDRRFWSHPGIDGLAVLRALWSDTIGGRHSGASTIAMQIARLQHPAPRTLWAKAVEAATGIVLTAHFGREALLAHYLRIVPYGNGSHGIAHAARWYFDKPVEDLSWAEIALLSAIPQSPTRMNPLRRDGLDRAVKRGHRIIDELARAGVIDAAERGLAHRQLKDMRPLSAPQRPEALHAVLRYEMMARSGRVEPRTPSDPRIRTTVDLDMQRRVTLLARRYLNAWRSAGAEQVAVMVVARGTAEVLATVGSADYNGRSAGALDFSRVQRSPGSTLKPFIYALALDRGVLKVTDVMADLPDGAAGINNADGHFLGPMLPRQALANSRNVPATNLLRDLGLETTYRFLRAAGLHDFETPADSFGLSMAIGSLPTSLDRLVRAYGALAEDGLLANLRWYEGETRREPVRIMTTETARLVTSFLADPMARLPSFPRYGPLEFPFPVAVKTGTSQGYRDAWTVAWSGRYLVGVWLGRADNGTMTQVSGVRSAARLAHAIMMQLHGTLPGDVEDVEFPSPPGRVAVELCVLGGRRSAGHCGETLREWVDPDALPPFEEVSILRHEVEGDHLSLVVPAAHRTWAREEGYPIEDTPAGQGPVRLTIVAPEQNTRIWRNPEIPQALDRLMLKVVVEPHVPQVVWYVDGIPFATTDPDVPVLWPMTPGTHRFQVRLPLQEGRSPLVRAVVE